MRTVIVDVGNAGTRIDLVLKGGATSGQVVLVVSDTVDINPPAPAHAAPPRAIREHQSTTGFPPRALTEETIVQILNEHGGSVQIRDAVSGWNIYDEVAARLGVSVEAGGGAPPGPENPLGVPRSAIVART